MWYGKPANYSRLRVFGCEAYVLHTPVGRTKLDPRSRKCIFLGYDKSVKGYRLWDPETKKLVISRDVSFNELSSLKEGEKVPTTQVEGEVEHEFAPKSVVETPTVVAPPTTLPPVVVAPEEQEQVATDEAESSRRSSSRVTKGQGPERYGTWYPSETIDDEDSDDSGTALLTEDGDPSTFEEAMGSTEKAEWNAAMQKEMKSLVENKTWELSVLPEGKQVVDSKWVYKTKDSVSGKDEKIYKARLVAKGFTQRKGVDYNEIFSPVVAMATIRLLMALVVLFDLCMEQMDVVTAFLYGLLEELIFMKQPQGFVKKGKEDLVCKLLKSLYGLKQSPRQWNKRFYTYMRTLGFIQSEYDCCLYMKKVNNKVFGFIVLILYVDDMIIVAKEMAEVNKLKMQLSSEFSMKDLGPARFILGMEIHRDRKQGKLWLTQSKYTNKVLAKLNMASAKAMSVPLAAHFKLSAAHCPTDAIEKGLMSKIPYDSAVGSLMYLMVCTRPDIAHAVGVVSRYMANPGKVHWEAVKWILRYLQGTSKVGLLFDAQSNNAMSLVGYVDSDYGGDLDNRKSTSRYTFTLAGGCVSWRSTKQKCISQSSTEAEYVAAAEASKEAIWLNKLVKDLGIPQERVNLHCDNTSALHIATNQMTHGRVKHIDIKYHFIRQAVSDKQIELVKIDTKLNPADMFTKVIPLIDFSGHCARLQILHKHT
ncbi:unnamed protein product [Calypogeia fissa]